jgi:hypothetical protein
VTHSENGTENGNEMERVIIHAEGVRWGSAGASIIIHAEGVRV